MLNKYTSHPAGLLALGAAIALSAIGAPQAWAQTRADSLETLARTYEQRLAVVEKERENAAARFDKAAEKVNRLKVETQNFLQRRRLERALRELQVLAEKTESLERQQQQLKTALDTTLAALWLHYDAEVTRLAEILETGLPEDARQEKMRALAMLRRKRAEVAGRIAVVPALLDSLPRWALGPEEDYRRLEDKAALLLDRAARLRQEAASADRRLKQLRDEVALRERLNELASEVALFDQRDETARPMTQGASRASLETGPGRGVSDYTAEGTAGRSGVVAPAGRLWSADPSQLSTAEARLFMRELEAEKGHLLAMADTLTARSQELTKRAEALRAQRAPSPR
ncbi:MAG: hypothetical protein QHJ34_15870 [bacterium]|jgi:hypothetical protein|nr:hypothetical protein [candidate division KSB1 bacterium]MDH7561680.1 hypothetical protein [bacterium]